MLQVCTRVTHFALASQKSFTFFSANQNWVIFSCILLRQLLWCIWITLCCKAIWSVGRETENAYEISDLWSRSKKSSLEGIKWLKVESESQAIYRIYKSYTLSDVRYRLNDAMSCDSLTFGGNAFQSLLAKNVKDRCINSRLKGGKLSLVLSPLKLYGTSLELKKQITDIWCPLVAQAFVQDN